MTLKKVLLILWIFIGCFLSGQNTFAAAAPASCKGVNVSAYLNPQGTSPDQIYKYSALAKQLKTSLTSNVNVNCYNDLYQKGRADHAAYWADRLEKDGCKVTPRGQVAGFCASSNEAQRSIAALSNIDRDLKEDASDMLEDSNALEAEARGTTAVRGPACPLANGTGVAAAQQLHDQLCCGSPQQEGGVIRAIENINYPTCIGKMRPTNRSIASASGALSCLVNAVKAAASTIWDSITSIFKLPGELWGARSQIWALITQPAARAQFARTMMDAIKHFFTDRVEAFKCYNEYEKAQYLCKLGGQIIISCAMPETFGAFIGLAAKPVGQAAKLIGSLLSRSPKGGAILRGIQTGARAAAKAARAVGTAAGKVNEATGGIPGRLVKAGEAVRRTIGRPLSSLAERAAKRIEGSASYRNLLASAYRTQRRTAAATAARVGTVARIAEAEGEVATTAGAGARAAASEVPPPREVAKPSPSPEVGATPPETPRPSSPEVAPPREVVKPSAAPEVAPPRDAPSTVAVAPRAAPAEAPAPVVTRAPEVSAPRVARTEVAAPEVSAPRVARTEVASREVSAPRPTAAPSAVTPQPVARIAANVESPPAITATASASPPPRISAGGGNGQVTGFAAAKNIEPGTVNFGNQGASVVEGRALAGAGGSGSAVRRTEAEASGFTTIESSAPASAKAAPARVARSENLNPNSAPAPERIAINNSPAPVREPAAGATSALPSAARAPSAAAAREVQQVAAVKPSAPVKPSIEAPGWTENEFNQFAAASNKSIPTLDSRNSSILSGLKPTDEVTAIYREIGGAAKPKRVTVSKLLEDAGSSSVDSIQIERVHLPKVAPTAAVRAKLEPGLLSNKAEILDARVEFASGEMAKFSGSREQLIQFAKSNNVKAAVTWSDAEHIAPPITRMPEAKRLASFDPVQERLAKIPKENITTSLEGDLSGATIMHGTSSNFRASVEKGPRNIGRGYGGDGLYTTLEDGGDYAKLYADKASKEWKNRAQWDSIKPTEGAATSEVMVGTINPAKELKVGVFEIKRDGVTDLSRGVLSGQDWANDAILRKTLKENFDVLDLRGAARNEIPGLPDRMLIFSERAGPDAILWKPRGTPMPNPTAAALAETAASDAKIAAAVTSEPTSRGTKIVNRILKENGKTPEELRSLVIQNASRTDEARRAAIRREFPELNRTVKNPETGAEVNLVDAIVDDVHRIGGRRHGAGVYNYSPEEIAAKARRLRQYGVPAADREALIRLGHAGDVPPELKVPAGVRARVEKLQLSSIREPDFEIKAGSRAPDELPRTQAAINTRISKWPEAGREKALGFIESLKGKAAFSRRDNYFAAILNAEPENVGAVVARLQRAEGRGTARQKVLGELDVALSAKTTEIISAVKRGRLPTAIKIARQRSALDFERTIIAHRDDLRVTNIFDANVHNDLTLAKNRKPHSSADTFNVDVEVTSNKFSACRGSSSSLTSVSSIFGGYLSLCRQSGYNSRKEVIQLSAAPFDKNVPEPEAGYSRFNRFAVKKGTRFSLGQNKDVIYGADGGEAIAGTGGVGGGVEIFCARSTKCITIDDLAASVRTPSCERISSPACDRIFKIQESIRSGDLAGKSNVNAHLNQQLAEVNDVLRGMSKNTEAYFKMLIDSNDTAGLRIFRANHPELVSALNLRREIQLKLNQAEAGTLTALDADTAEIIRLDKSLAGIDDRLDTRTSRLPSGAATPKEITATINQAIDAEASAVVTAYREKLASIKREQIYLRVHPPLTASQEVDRLAHLNTLAAQKNDILLQVKALENSANKQVKKLGAGLTEAQRAEVQRNVFSHITGA